MSFIKKFPILRSFLLTLPGPNGSVTVNELKGKNYLMVNQTPEGLVRIQFSYKALSECNPSTMPFYWLNTSFKVTNKLSKKAFEKMLADFRAKTGEKA